MRKAIETVMKLAGVSLRDAIALAARNPARIGRIASRQRGLNTGERADFTRFRYDEAANEIEVLETYLNGSLVYSSAQPSLAGR
jgi:N-acetylglucosamine-6-phosphate deacetylase